MDPNVNIQAINELTTQLTSIVNETDFVTLLLKPTIDMFPAVFTVLLAIAGLKKGVGFARSIIGA